MKQQKQVAARSGSSSIWRPGRQLLQAGWDGFEAISNILHKQCGKIIAGCLVPIWFLLAHGVVRRASSWSCRCLQGLHLLCADLLEHWTLAAVLVVDVVWVGQLSAIKGLVTG